MRYFISLLLLSMLPTVSSFAQPSVNTASSNGPPDMQRKADLSLFTKKEVGYRFIQLDFNDTHGVMRHRAHVLVPDIPAPKQGFPVLYALDGNALPALLNTQQLRQLATQSPLVFVFIAPANDLRLDGDARAYDYTPPSTDNKPLVDALNPKRKNGGAAEFLSLITQHIRPAVEKLTKINPQQQTLWGHSYGGLFVLYALQHTAGFSQYIAADPSLWWQDGLFLHQSEDFLASPPSFLTTQLWIEKSAQTHKKVAQNATQQALIDKRERATHSISPQAQQQFIHRLSQLHGLSVHYQVYPEHNHGSLFSASFEQAIAKASQPYYSIKSNNEHKQ